MEASHLLSLIHIYATDHYFPDHVIKAGATVWQGGINLSFGQEYVSLNLSGVYPNHTEVEVVKLFKGRILARSLN